MSLNQIHVVVVTFCFVSFLCEHSGVLLIQAHCWIFNKMFNVWYSQCSCQPAGICRGPQRWIALPVPATAGEKHSIHSEITMTYFFSISDISTSVKFTQIKFNILCLFHNSCPFVSWQIYSTSFLLDLLHSTCKSSREI